jgi:hypothetical protein
MVKLNEFSHPDMLGMNCLRAQGKKSQCISLNAIISASIIHP